MDEIDALHHAESRLDSPASFIPAVHDERRDEALAALLAWRAIDRLHGPDGDEGWGALLRLRDVADRLGAA